MGKRKARKFQAVKAATIPTGSSVVASLPPWRDGIDSPNNRSASPANQSNWSMAMFASPADCERGRPISTDNA
jgi:hypothetical protein